MALFGSASASQVWRAPRDLPQFGGRPIWISLWTRSSGTNTSGMASFGTTTGGVTSAGPYVTTTTISAWDQNDSGSSQIDTLGTLPGVAIWQHVLAYYPAANSRAVYINGVLGSANATVLSGPQTFNALVVGTVRTTALWTDRAVAEVTFGRGLLSGEQIRALAGGRNPLVVVPAAQILGYFPLRGDFSDLGPVRGGLQPVGGVVTKWTDHPPADPPPRRRLFFAPAVGGTARPLTPAGTASTTQAATLGRTRALTVAGTASTSQAATLTRSRQIGATLQNLIRNSVMAGATPGTPGTAPTNMSVNWSAGGGTLAGQIVGTGTEGGFDYIDVRVAGTNGAAATSEQFFVETNTGVQVAQPSTGAATSVTMSAYMRVVAGSIAGFAPVFQEYGYGAGGGLVSIGGTTSFSPTGTLTRFWQTTNFSTTTVRYARPIIDLVVNANATVDVTLRIAGVQLEPVKSVPNPYMATSGSAVSAPYLATAASSQSATVSHLLTSAAATASTTQAATLTRSRALTVAGTAATSQTATARALHALTPAATASTSQAATLGRTRALAAAGAATTAQTAAVGRARPVTVAGSATTTQAGTVHALRALACAGTAATGQTAALARSRRLTAAGTASTTQTSPSLGRFGTGQLSASGTAGTGQTATLHAIRALVATGLAVSSQAASSARSRAASPSASAAVSSQAAQLGRLRPLTPLGATAGTGQVGAQRAARALRAAGVAATGQGMAMGRLRPLLAAGTAISTQSGGISASGLPIGDVPASHTITIPLDTRTILVPLDTRTILIPR